MFCTTSVQLAPPSLLTWIFSPAPSAPLLPDTVSVVSLVMKSPTVPLSVAIAVIASASAGAVVSMPWLSRPDRFAATAALPAASVAPPATRLSATLPDATPAAGFTTTV